MTQSSYTINELVTLYALVGRIRLSASEQVVRAAEDVVKLIVARYGEANLTLEDLRVAALSSKTDPFDLFSTACRKDLYTLPLMRSARPGSGAPSGLQRTRIRAGILPVQVRSASLRPLSASLSFLRLVRIIGARMRMAHAAVDVVLGCLQRPEKV
jgi:hypothetical protein